MSGAIRFSLVCLVWAQPELSMPGRTSVSRRSRQSLTRSIPHEPPIGQTQIFVGCTSGCARSGGASLTAIRTVLESGPALIPTVWGPTIRLSFGSVII